MCSITILFALMALLISSLFAAQGRASCLVDNCVTDADCSTCSVVTGNNEAHYIWSGAPYRCAGGHANHNPPIEGKCMFALNFLGTEDYSRMKTACRLSKSGCCDPSQAYNVQMQQCSRKSCRIPTGCTIDGVCEYDLENDAQGNTVQCCNADDDCPPFAPPNFWDASNVPLGDRMCKSVRCDLTTHNCVYEQVTPCCASDSPDCDSYTNPAARCSRGACIYNAQLATAVGLNPFSQEGQEALSEEIQKLIEKKQRVETTYMGLQNHPLQCEMRVDEGCECTSDADCVILHSPCADARCVLEENSARRVCKTYPKYGSPHANTLCCISGIEDCVNEHDSCAIAVSCDSQGTTLHQEDAHDFSSLVPHGSLLLPSFECTYIRKTMVASCCASDADCDKLARVNECVKDVCLENDKKCALNEKGYPIMGGKYQMPCCQTTADCYADGGALANKFSQDSSVADEACLTLHCTGDDTNVEPSMRHKCIPKFHAECPKIGDAMFDVIQNAVVQAAFETQMTMIKPTVTLDDCSAPLLLEIKAAVDLTETQQPQVRYPYRIEWLLRLQSATAPMVWQKAFLAMVAHDNTHPEVEFTKMEYRIEYGKSPSSLRSYVDLSNVKRPIVGNVEVTTLFYLNSTLLASVFGDSDCVGGGGISLSHVVMEWSDGSSSVLGIENVAFEPIFVQLQCAPKPEVLALVQRTPVEPEASVQSIGYQIQAPTPLPTPPTPVPTQMPTPMPTPMPTYPESFSLCAPFPAPPGGRHCDAFGASCMNVQAAGAPNGVCGAGVNIGKCLTPNISVNTGAVQTIPASVLRDQNDPFVDILSTESFCWPVAGQCFTADNTSCQCSCGCAIFTPSLLRWDFTNCVDGPLLNEYNTTNVTITNSPTNIPTPMPTFFTPTPFPTNIPPVPTPFPPQCGTPTAFCSPSSSCETRLSTCDTITLGIYIASWNYTNNITCTNLDLDTLISDFTASAFSVYAIPVSDLSFLTVSCTGNLTLRFSLTGTAGSAIPIMALLRFDIENTTAGPPSPPFIAGIPALDPNQGSSGGVVVENELKYCTSGCGFSASQLCTVNSNCTNRDCCGCQASGYDGFASCIAYPVLATDSPTAAPTPPAPTPAPTPPTPFPTNFPTPAPTPEPTFADAGGVPLNGHCKDGKPWLNPIPPNSTYTDVLPNTSVTVFRDSNFPCVGCALYFHNPQCQSVCLRGGGTHFSFPVHLSFKNLATEAQDNLPNRIFSHPRVAEVTQARDGVVFSVRLDPCEGTTEYVTSCTTITPLDSSYEVWDIPSNMKSDAKFNLTVPVTSAHGEVRGTASSFTVIRSSSLYANTSIEVDVYIEGCTSLSKIEESYEKMCFRVTAQMYSGLCEALVYSWETCETNAFLDSASGGYPWDFRKCIHKKEFNVSANVYANSTEQLYNCTQCPPAPPPTFPVVIREKEMDTRTVVRTEAELELGDSHVQAVGFNPLAFTGPAGVYVNVRPDVGYMPQSELDMCALNTSSKYALDTIFAKDFNCDIYPRFQQYDDDDDLGRASYTLVQRCADNTSELQVLRFAVDVHHLNAALSTNTISGRLRIKIKRQVFQILDLSDDDDESVALTSSIYPGHVCTRFTAQYRFVVDTSETSLKVENTCGEKNEAQLDLRYMNLHGNKTLTVYVYVMLCDSTNYDFEPTRISVDAHVTDDDDLSNGAKVICDSHTYYMSRCKDVYEFTNNPSNFTDVFDCAELDTQHDGNDLGCLPETACTHNDNRFCYKRNATVPIFLALVIFLTVAGFVALCYFLARRSADKKVKRK